MSDGQPASGPADEPVRGRDCCSSPVNASSCSSAPRPPEGDRDKRPQRWRKTLGSTEGEVGSSGGRGVTGTDAKYLFSLVMNASLSNGPPPLTTNTSLREAHLLLSNRPLLPSDGPLSLATDPFTLATDRSPWQRMPPLATYPLLSERFVTDWAEEQFHSPLLSSNLL